MTMPVAGNAVVANFLMRFPILIPVAVAAVATVAVLPAAPPPPPPAPVVVAPAPAPAPAPVVTPKPLEVLCPPIEKTAKLHNKEKQALLAKGCKVKG